MPGTENVLDSFLRRTCYRVCHELKKKSCLLHDTEKIRNINEVSEKLKVENTKVFISLKLEKL